MARNGHILHMAMEWMNVTDSSGKLVFPTEKTSSNLCCRVTLLDTPSLSAQYGITKPITSCHPILFLKKMENR